MSDNGNSVINKVFRNDALRVVLHTLFIIFLVQVSAPFSSTVTNFFRYNYWIKGLVIFLYVALMSYGIDDKNILHPLIGFIIIFGIIYLLQRDQVEKELAPESSVNTDKLVAMIFLLNNENPNALKKILGSSTYNAHSPNKTTVYKAVYDALLNVEGFGSITVPYIPKTVRPQFKKSSSEWTDLVVSGGYVSMTTKMEAAGDLSRSEFMIPLKD